MFFFINLVFATGSTRVISESASNDIVLNLKTNDYVLTNAIIDPVNGQNVPTYILKDNAIINFQFESADIISDVGTVTNLYYRTYKGKNLTIRNREFSYMPSADIMLVHDETFDVLKATNRLHDSLFKFIVKYKVKRNGQESDREKHFYFKVVSDKTFQEYKRVHDAENMTTGEIKKPKKQN